jgi:hypothetical protein
LPVCAQTKNKPIPEGIPVKRVMAQLAVTSGCQECETDGVPPCRDNRDCEGIR